MLLRNLNLKKGLCNGTRLIVRNIYYNFLDVEIISGNGKLSLILKCSIFFSKFLLKAKHIGSRVFLPKIELHSQGEDLPFVLKRLQFPTRLAFCMTINKISLLKAIYLKIN